MASPGRSGARRPASSLPQLPPQLTAAPPSGLRPALPEEPPLLLLLLAAAACEAAPIHRRAACVAAWRFRPLPREHQTSSKIIIPPLLFKMIYSQPVVAPVQPYVGEKEDQMDLIMDGRPQGWQDLG
ncbi:uncharacterized protein M6D78_019445 [Vipera latastei]